MSVSVVKEAEANLKKKNVTVKFENEVSKELLIEAINKAGYEAK